MCLATHEWQAMIFYKGQAAAWEGCIAAPMVAVLSLLDAGRTRALILGGTRHLTASAKATDQFGNIVKLIRWYTSSNRIRKGDTVTVTTSAETGQSDIVCRFYPGKYVFW